MTEIATTEIATTAVADGRGWARPEFSAERRLRRRRNRFVARQLLAQAWRKLGSGLEWVMAVAIVVWLYLNYGQEAAVAAGVVAGLGLVVGGPLGEWLRWRRDSAEQHNETVLDGLAVIAVEGEAGPAWDLPWRQEVDRPVEPALVWLQMGWDGGMPRPYAGHTGSPYLAVVPELRDGTYTGRWLAVHTPTGLLLGGHADQGLEFAAVNGAIDRVAGLDWSDPDPEAYRGATYGDPGSPTRRVWDAAVMAEFTPRFGSFTAPVAPELPAGTPHHVPEWVESWVAPTHLSKGDMRALLVETHRKLLEAATTGPGRPQYLAAATVLDRLLHEFNRTGADVYEPVRRCLAEVVSVLGSWDTSTRPEHAFARFELARGWVRHTEQVIDCSRATRGGA